MTSLYLGLTLLLISLALLYLSGRQRRLTGLPRGQVIYTDTRTWGRLEKPLFDPALGLTGKPDYLVEQGGSLIPVEVKTGRTPPAPYESHVFQLAVYCLLVHRTYGKRPSHGILHYPSRDFAIDYTPALESSLLRLLDSIRRDELTPVVNRSHNDPRRCRSCGFLAVCDQKLV